MNRTLGGLYSVITRLPDNRLTKPIKKRIENELAKETELQKQDIQKKNWILTMMYQQLKQMVDDPNTPEAQKEELQKKMQELEPRIQNWQERAQKYYNGLGKK